MPMPAVVADRLQGAVMHLWFSDAQRTACGLTGDEAGAGHVALQDDWTTCPDCRGGWTGLTAAPPIEVLDNKPCPCGEPRVWSNRCHMWLCPRCDEFCETDLGPDVTDARRRDSIASTKLLDVAMAAVDARDELTVSEAQTLLSLMKEPLQYTMG